MASKDLATAVAQINVLFGDKRKSKKTPVDKADDKADDMTADDDSYATFAERERQKILDLDMKPRPSDAVIDLEIERRWHMFGKSQSLVPPKAKPVKPTTTTKTCDDESKQVHTKDYKLTPEQEKELGVKLIDTMKDKFVYIDDVEKKEDDASSNKSPAATGKSPAASVKSPAASGKSPAASGKSPAASGKSPAASGKSPAATGKRKADSSAKKLKTTSTPASETDIADKYAEIAGSRLIMKARGKDGKFKPATIAAVKTLLEDCFEMDMSTVKFKTTQDFQTAMYELSRHMHFETDDEESDDGEQDIVEIDEDDDDDYIFGDEDEELEEEEDDEDDEDDN